MPPQELLLKDAIEVAGRTGRDAPNPSELFELKTCSIKISINLDNFSKNFSPPVLKALEESGLQTFDKELKFFIPNNFRTLEDETDSCEKIGKLCSELEEWVEDYFGHLFVPGYKEKIAQHGVAIIFWLCPFHPVDSPQFKILCILCVVASIGDDWMDGANPQNSAQFLKLLSNMLDKSGEGDDTQVFGGLVTKSKNLSLMDVVMKEPIIAAFYDSITYVEDMLKKFKSPAIPRKDNNDTDLFAPFKKYLLSLVHCYNWRHDQCGRNVVGDYSIETCRYFRQFEGMLESFPPMMGLMEDLNLHSNIVNHTIFKKWKDLAAKMEAIQNDVLGFEKDLREGEEEGILLQKIKRGLSIREALNEELHHFSEWSSDYVNLRRILLGKFQDAKFVRYVEILDAILFGNFSTYVGSKRYGMKRGQIEIIHD